MAKKNPSGGNTTNQWVGEMSKAVLADLSRTTGIPKSRLVWCGLELFRQANASARSAVIDLYAKAKDARRETLKS